MIYMLLTKPYKDFDKVNIVSFTFNATRIVFNYKVYLTEDNSCFNKTMSIADPSIIASIKEKKYDGYTPYDAICRALLEYLKNEGIEVGTIEVA